MLRTYSVSVGNSHAISSVLPLIVDIYGIGSPLRDSYSANQKMILKRAKVCDEMFTWSQVQQARFIFACE